MLSIKPIGGSLAEVAYYAHLGEAENHDYYSQEGDRPGVWWGEGAKALRLTGQVNPKEFKRVLQGMSPDGKRELVQIRKNSPTKRRAGFDLTWSLPKSYSVTWSQLGPSERVLLDGLVEQALHATLETFQELCGMTRRGKNGCTLEDAQLIVAIFSHDTARGLPGEVPDANRHFHAVVSNVVVREDGTTGALDARPLFQRRMKMALGALFRAELSMLLETKLGLKTFRPERETNQKRAAWWELVGVPQKLLQAMSKRRQEIEKWLREHGLTGAKAAEKAALVTRKEKQRLDTGDLNAAWRKTGEHHGFSQREAEQLLCSGVPREVRQEAEREAAVARALKSLMDGNARFSENELLERTAVEAQTCGIGIADIRIAVEKTLRHSPEIIRLEDAKGVRTYTTREMLQIEASLLETASRLHRSTAHAVSYQNVQEVTRDYETLRKEQAEAVREISVGGDLVVITGLAGTGKTYMLSVARKVLERAGFHVLGTALAAKATRGLAEDSGIHSVHLHKLFHDIEHGKIILDKQTVLVVDEAGMVGTKQLAQVVESMEAAGGKVILVGDHRQLQAIDAGAPFRAIGETVGTTELTQIIRQRDKWARRVVKNFRDGKALKALTELQNRGQLFLGADREAALQQIITDWQRLALGKRGNLEETLVYASTNLEVRELNARIQMAMRQTGQLGDFSLELNGQGFHLGDRVMVTKNNPLLHLLYGATGEVTGIDERRLWIRFDRGFEIEIDTDEFSQLALGYAMSVHKAQGVTCENALVLTGDGMTDRELSYVATSRSRGKTIVYSDELSAGPLAELAELMRRSRQKEMAHEHLRDLT